MSALLLALAMAAAPAPDARFRQANELLRSADYPKAIAAYEELAGAGAESASLYWNWAQAAAARGAQGEALWALLRARELEPGDRAVSRQIEEIREALHLDAAELAPEPLAALRRVGRRWRLDLLAAALLALSCASHALVRLRPASRWAVQAAGLTLVLGIVAGLLPAAASLARPTGVVVRAGAPLLDSASAAAEAIGSLREGEVVPLLKQSGGYVQVEDSSGARGWTAAGDVRPVE